MDGLNAENRVVDELQDREETTTAVECIAAADQLEQRGINRDECLSLFDSFKCFEKQINKLLIQSEEIKCG